MNFVDSVCDIIFLSHAKAQRAQSFLLSTDYTDYTDFPRDPRDPWRYLGAPQGICEITFNLVDYLSPAYHGDLHGSFVN